MPEERSVNLWLVEKTEHSIGNIINLRDILNKKVDLTGQMPWGETIGEYLDGSLYPALYDLTKILAFAYDNQHAWQPTDRDLIIREGERGLKMLIGRYDDWAFLEKTSEI